MDFNKSGNNVNDKKLTVDYPEEIPNTDETQLESDNDVEPDNDVGSDNDVESDEANKILNGLNDSDQTDVRNNILQDLRIEPQSKNQYTPFVSRFNTEPYVPTIPTNLNVTTPKIPANLDNIAEAIENIQTTMSKLGNQLGLLVLTLRDTSSKISTIKGGTRGKKPTTHTKTRRR